MRGLRPESRLSSCLGKLLEDTHQAIDGEPHQAGIADTREFTSCYAGCSLYLTCRKLANIEDIDKKNEGPEEILTKIFILGVTVAK